MFTGATQAITERSLPHWRAYNETIILGLNPNQDYLLSDVPRDFSQVHINTLPEGVSVTETRVTANAAVFRLERLSRSYEIDLISKFHRVRTGIVVDGKELTLQKGATLGCAKLLFPAFGRRRLLLILLIGELAATRSVNSRLHSQKTPESTWSLIWDCSGIP